MKIATAATGLIAFAVLAIPAMAQSAPGANADLAVLSTDLQNSRKSAAAIQTQADEKRKLRALAAKTEAGPPDSGGDQAEAPSSDREEFTATIPMGNGLVPAHGVRVKTRAESD